jgi:hypothetical protein
MCNKKRVMNENDFLGLTQNNRKENLFLNF